MLRNHENDKKGQQLDSALFKRLDQLIMKIPKDASLFVDQVSQHTITFQQQFKNLISDTQRKNQRFGQLVTFLARCARFYKSLQFLPTAIMDLLNNYGAILHPYNRRKAVGCIFILRAKSIMFPVSTVEFLLRLMNLQDKQLRKTIYKYVLNDIRRMNKHSKNQKINQGIKNFMQNYNKTHADKTVQKNIQLIIDLYKRNIWTDTRAVNIIAEGCLNQSPKVRLLSAHFLLDTTQKIVEQEDSSQDQRPLDIRAKKGIVKQTKVREKQLEKQKKKAAKRLRKKEVLARKTNYMPIDLIYSPQQFCEKVYTFLTNKSEKFNRRLVFMSLVARIIWRHQLILLPFYGFLTKYMLPHQKQITRVLAAFAESLHQNIPEDEVQGIIKLIVQKFVNDKCSEFAMTIGLNTIRQAAIKIPTLLTEELMLYLCTYYDYKNRNVSTAAKALINFVRSNNPQILQKKFRGRPGQYQIQDSEKKKGPIVRIPGANLLPHSGNIPIQMDRILTDQDFKMIKKLRRKQQQEIQQDQAQKEQQRLEKQQRRISGQKMQDEGDEQGEQEQCEQQQNDSDCSQIDSDQEEIEQLEEFDFQQGQQEGQQQVQQQGQEDQQSGEQDQQAEQSDENMQDQIDWDNAQQIQDEDQIADKKSNKKNSKKEKVQSSQYSESEQESDNNNGFINLDRIGFYKKTKGQTKAQRLSGINQEPKFKHKPKEKKGGTTNREKQKMKPLLMLRSKKNRIRNKEKQVKLKIKDLKNKLGKVKSKKHASKVKNKLVKKS